MQLRSITLLFLLVSQFTFSQLKLDRKKISTTRISTPPKINGVLNDDAWKNAELIKDFIVFRPDNGKIVANEYRTEVKVIYDNEAIYISAMLYDPSPDKIPMQFATRDNFSQADFFLVTINPNDDGQNPFEFLVQSTGNQADSKVSNGNEDFNWSAVWESAAKINKNGWAVEMKIPYSALRFANSEIQHWGFNFHRRLERLNEQHTWTHIDNAIGRCTQHDGLIENFKNIKPPTRLGLYPYASAITDSYNGTTTNDWSIGLDIKYGLSENFTLDATLIPDFSQVGFDDVTLNLGPFDQQFAEQRQFFTEGTELFNKGRLFYSRRIGSRPIDQFNVSGQLNANEEIINSPEKVTMLNAIKISGRTKNGLGIGFFNAITDKTEATIKNNSTGNIRKEITNPFSNYNILVLDKQFNQNSSVTLINTNVTRDSKFRDANVTGLLWHVEDKKSNYNIDGSIKITAISDDINNSNTGKAFDTSIGKQSGKWRGEIGYNFEDKNYNPNDLGILFNNNNQSFYGFVGYRLLKPKGVFNNYGINLNYKVNFLHESDTYTGSYFDLAFWSNTKSRHALGGSINISTKGKYFNEPRQGNTSGIFFETPLRLNLNHWGETNTTKKLSLRYYMQYTYFKDNAKRGYGFNLTPSYRFTNQFSIKYSFNFDKLNNDQGYVTKDGNDIIFGQRDRASYENSISGKYNFSTKSSLSLAFRHNWTKVPYKDTFLKLNTTSGTLESSNYNSNHNISFNSWNLDVNYVWQFAPGSQLIALYRNSIMNQDSNSSLNFFKNLDNLFQQPNRNVFSLRLVYYIDYNRLKNIF